MTDATDFLALSELLTGETDLDEQLAEAYRGRLSTAYPQDLPALLTAYRAAVAQGNPLGALTSAVNADPKLARITRETVTVWYTAQFLKPDDTPDAPATPQQYQAGLIWQVIKAHPLATAPVPPAASGYGYWTQHP
ncbi:sugar dehydrogenase complex small subunit [Kitasatospora sp. NPDC004799]|uniref:sugar dehydrogenase complex small subunit n=1 Tax=Kitasatospora sp. NPDC004799 TaxID=3154460 RepID=UPI0033B8FAC4